MCRIYTGNKKCFYITADLEKVLESVNENRNRKIALILSGDTGFHSMLAYMKKHFSEKDLEVVPGISSIQYMFAKISDYWHDACLLSVHGKKSDYVKSLKKNGKVGLLTDFKENTPQKIAQKLYENGLGEALILVGENLSYENERIYEFSARELKNYKEKFGMNVVILKVNKNYRNGVDSESDFTDSTETADRKMEDKNGIKKGKITETDY